MLVNRYATVDGEKQLTACADNWIEYIALQNNLEMTIQTLSANYEQYQNCNDLYKRGCGQSEICGPYDVNRWRYEDLYKCLGA